MWQWWWLWLRALLPVLRLACVLCVTVSCCCAFQMQCTAVTVLAAGGMVCMLCMPCLMTRCRLLRGSIMMDTVHVFMA